MEKRQRKKPEVKPCCPFNACSVNPHKIKIKKKYRISPFCFFSLLLKSNLSALFSDISYGAGSNTGLKLAWLLYV